MITKNDLIQNVAAVTENSKKDVELIVNALFDNVVEVLSRGEEISIHKFGKFIVKDTKEKQGINPSTLEPITIAASKRLSFKPSTSLKAVVKGI